MPTALTVYIGLLSGVDLVLLMTTLFGHSPAWLARNVHRALTLFYLVSGLFYGDRVGWICFVLGLFTWNSPRDKDDPPRRRRREEKKAEETKPDWTGAAVPQGA